MTTQKTKKCFIITPIGTDKSSTREKAEGVIDVIKPILEKHDFNLIIPHKMPEPGSITQQILECILNHELVIANLTELNPNVMYELAVRHASGLPIITIAEEGTKLPFDITTERTIFYTDDMKGVLKLQGQMEDAIKSIDFLSYEPNNPIYRAKQNFEMKEVASKDENIYILEQLDSLKNRIDENLKETRISKEYINTLLECIFYGDKPFEHIYNTTRYTSKKEKNKVQEPDSQLYFSFFKQIQDLGNKMFNEDENNESIPVE